MWCLDSFKFMSNSLSFLVKNLTKEDMEVAYKLYDKQGITDKKIDILSKKNIFHYLWCDSYDKIEGYISARKKIF